MANGSDLTASIADLDADQALAQVEARIAQNDDPQTILLECRQGMEAVGARFQAGEYFTADLVFAADIFTRAMDIIRPELRKQPGDEKLGRVTIATVKDDIHDIGKNLVATMLAAAGFDVVDLGADVPAHQVCESIQQNDSHIVALSCLLTTTVDSMETTIQAIATAGLRHRVKIIVGGIPLSPSIASAIGADGFGANAQEAVVRCKELMGKQLMGAQQDE